MEDQDIAMSDTQPEDTPAAHSHSHQDTDHRSYHESVAMPPLPSSEAPAGGLTFDEAPDVEVVEERLTENIEFGESVSE